LLRSIWRLLVVATVIVPLNVEAEPSRILFDYTHGEFRTVDISGIYRDFAEALRSEGFVVDALRVGTLSPDVLSSYDVLVVAVPFDPSKPFTDSEIDAVRNFVDQGGGLFLVGVGWSWVTYFPYSISQYPANVLGAQFGIRFNDDFLIDPTNFVPGRGEANPVFHEFSRHPTTSALSSVSALYGIPCTITASSGTTVVFGDGDSRSSAGYYQTGEYPPVAVALRYGEGRVFALGQDGFFTNMDDDNDGIINLDEYDNKRFGVNIMHWLSGVTANEPPTGPANIVIADLNPKYAVTGQPTRCYVTLKNVGGEQFTARTALLLILLYDRPPFGEERLVDMHPVEIRLPNINPGEEKEIEILTSYGTGILFWGSDYLTDKIVVEVREPEYGDRITPAFTVDPFHIELGPYPYVNCLLGVFTTYLSDIAKAAYAAPAKGVSTLSVLESSCQSIALTLESYDPESEHFWYEIGGSITAAALNLAQYYGIDFLPIVGTAISCWDVTSYLFNNPELLMKAFLRGVASQAGPIGWYLTWYYGLSPMDLVIVDSAGRRAGVEHAVHIVEEIPNSKVVIHGTGHDRHELVVVASQEILQHRLEIDSTGSGSATIGGTAIYPSGEETTMIHQDLQLSASMSATIIVENPMSDDYVLKIDQDGDGSVDSISPPTFISPKRESGEPEKTLTEPEVGPIFLFDRRWEHIASVTEGDSIHLVYRYTNIVPLVSGIEILDEQGKRTIILPNRARKVLKTLGWHEAMKLVEQRDIEVMQGILASSETIRDVVEEPSQLVSAVIDGLDYLKTLSADIPFVGRISAWDAVVKVYPSVGAVYDALKTLDNELDSWLEASTQVTESLPKAISSMQQSLQEEEVPDDVATNFEQAMLGLDSLAENTDRTASRIAEIESEISSLRRGLDSAADTPIVGGAIASVADAAGSLERSLRDVRTRLTSFSTDMRNQRKKMSRVVQEAETKADKYYKLWKRRQGAEIKIFGFVFGIPALTIVAILLVWRKKRRRQKLTKK